VRTLLVVLAVALATLPLAASAGTTARGDLAYVAGGKVYLYDPATGSSTQVTRAHSGGGDLALSPDGTRVAYTSPTPTGTDVWIVNADGSGNHLVTTWPNLASTHHLHFDPRWLRANSLSYLDASGGSGGYLLYMGVDLRTGRHRSLAREGTLYNSQVFAAGGKLVSAATVVRGNQTGCAATADLFLQTGAGVARQLTNTPNAWEVPVDYQVGAPILAVKQYVSSGPHQGGCIGPSAGVTAELRAYTPGKGSVLLVRFPAYRPTAIRSFDAAWSPDGKELAFVDEQGRLVVRDLASKRDRVVARGVTAVDW
jgi:hypothetical protein